MHDQNLAVDGGAESPEIGAARAAFAPDLEAFGLRNAAALKIRAFCSMVAKVGETIDSTDAYEAAKAAENQLDLELQEMLYQIAEQERLILPTIRQVYICS